MTQSCVIHQVASGELTSLGILKSYDKVGDYVCYDSQIDGLVQERRNSSALAMELRLSCTNPSI